MPRFHCSDQSTFGQRLGLDARLRVGRERRAEQRVGRRLIGHVRDERVARFLNALRARLEQRRADARPSRSRIL